MTQPPPLRSPQEEFEALQKRCDSLDDLSQLEPLLAEGMGRVARSLAQQAVRKRAEKPEARSAKESFPPSG